MNREQSPLMQGMRFGRLTANRYSHRGKDGAIYWLFLCDCGRSKIARKTTVKKGECSSCGCLQRELAARRMFKNGGKSHPENHVYHSMIARCENPRTQSFANYGGRGIKVCPRWRESFASFLSDMGSRPTPEHTLERLDNDKDYSPDNCTWATRYEQSNNRRNNISISYNGTTKNLKDWARHLGIKYSALYHRINKAGWAVERAFSTPVKQ